jgi:N-carbamoyl-L-amino-acid hydrolase
MDAAAVIERLRELDARSGGKRVAWGPVWREERERFLDWVRAEVPGADIARDVAGNLWVRVAGRSRETVLIGSHLDCVPDGGWLDGCLGVLAAAEVLRSLDEPRRSVALVDWADEEGSRFGHSLLGSSAACGLLDIDAAAGLRDAEGIALPDALTANGVELTEMPGAAAELEDTVAYIELHIEQGPVLDDAGIACAAVDGCLGVRRTELVFPGRAGHAGATPMDRRDDPLLAAAEFVLAARELAVEAGALATIGALRTEPGTPTAIADRVRCTLDLRHRELDALDRVNAEILARAGNAVAEPVWRIDPVRFDEQLVARAAELTGGGEPLTSGPLHDAAAVARAGFPTVMVFARTRGGISHSREEDADEADLIAAIDAYAALVTELAA